MKHFLSVLIAVLCSASLLHAQDKWFTKSGHISFLSKATIEDISAENRAATCVLDTKTGMIQLSVLIRGFEFEKALMQEHFNEDYMESDKYPQAIFKGTITNNASVQYKQSGKYAVKVSGQLTLHGITKPVEASGDVIISDKSITTNAVFTIQLKDFNIKNDKLNNISNTITITVSCLLEPLQR